MLSFLIKIFLYHCLPLSLSPDVLLHKLVEALQDAFRGDLRMRHTVPNYSIIKY